MTRNIRTPLLVLCLAAIGYLVGVPFGVAIAFCLKSAFPPLEPFVSPGSAGLVIFDAIGTIMVILLMARWKVFRPVRRHALWAVAGLGTLSTFMIFLHISPAPPGFDYADWRREAIYAGLVLAAALHFN